MSGVSKQRGSISEPKRGFGGKAVKKGVNSESGQTSHSNKKE